jgi:hypothetical protein
MNTIIRLTKFHELNVRNLVLGYPVLATQITDPL